MGIKIIAEAGVNHNGSLVLAKKMVDEAKEAGVDYIKFQTFIPEELVSSSAPKAAYQKAATGAAETQLQMLQRLALEEEEFQELYQYCRQKEIGFLSTPFDLGSIAFLTTLHMDFWKIPSGEITNLPYLRAIAKTKKPVVMSTGMCTIAEVDAAVGFLQKEEMPDITLLHCNTEYPTPMEDVNLSAMTALKQAFHLPVGYSDHTLGIEVPIAAAALGAVVLEKHFTLDKTLEGPDHLASLEPEELKEMVQAVRNIEKAIGNGEKKPSLSELKNRTAARKSIIARCRIPKGTVFSEDNLTAKRPGDGISPMRWDDIIGTTACRDFETDEKIAED